LAVDPSEPCTTAAEAPSLDGEEAAAEATGTNRDDRR
jgi:hypothetical protein